MSDPIVVTDSDPQWPAQFAALAARVRAALGGLAVAVEHVGSTAVLDLPAKPVIDIDVVIASDADLPVVTERLATVGYVAEGEKGVVARYAFLWPPGEPRHHLYVCPQDSPALREHLQFRDYLRAHPEEAARYAGMKRELASRFRDDRVAYNDGKTEYVRAVLAKADPEKEPCPRTPTSEKS